MPSSNQPTLCPSAVKTLSKHHHPRSELPTLCASQTGHQFSSKMMLDKPRCPIKHTRPKLSLSLHQYPTELLLVVYLEQHTTGALLNREEVAPDPARMATTHPATTIALLLLQIHPAFHLPPLLPPCPHSSTRRPRTIESRSLCHWHQQEHRLLYHLSLRTSPISSNSNAILSLSIQGKEAALPPIIFSSMVSFSSQYLDALIRLIWFLQ